MSDRYIGDLDELAIIELGPRRFNSALEEERYQAFKARLIDEVVARERSPHTAMWIDQELHDTTKRE